MGIVIFMVWPTSGKLHRLDFIAKVFNKVVIDEFAAIIAVKAFQWKRKPGLDIFYLLKDSVFAFAPDSVLFCPAGSDIN